MLTHNIAPMTPYQEFIHQSRYARFRDDLGRRETWDETITRYLDFFEDHLARQHGYAVPQSLRSEIYEAILNQQVMPSMRAMMTAGEALRLENAAGFNCSYLAISEVRSFAELLYILMCGTGVGFSVERQFIADLPKVPDTLTRVSQKIVVGDSKLGWAEAYLDFLNHLYMGEICEVDYSEVRAAGERLKTFGGRASGPEPLRQLIEFTLKTFRNAHGRRLESIECHELCCKIGEIVVVGGVRRSALISLSNLSDQRMRDAKSGNWFEHKAHLALANNSTAYTERPEVGPFLEEWTALYRSQSGERGIFNRQGVQKKLIRLGRRNPNFAFGVNPCGEINLRSKQFCNLTEDVIRETDTITDIEQKTRIATILGTWQSTLTNYRFLSPEWTLNSEEERLLGVSMTGIFSNPLTCQSGPGLRERLTHFKNIAIDTNKTLAKDLGIPQSAAITTVKPSGTVSQLVNSPSGIHPDHAPFYIRRVRGDNKDPLTQFLIHSGIPAEPDVTKPESTTVFSFPMKSQSKVFRDKISAKEHLELVLDFNTAWSEHAVSCTISVRENEWPSIGGWVFDNFDNVCGLSFLPFFEGDSVYPQMPYETISEETYKESVSKMPTDIDWTILATYDQGKDNTTGTQTLACTGSSCEIVNITN